MYATAPKKMLTFLLFKILEDNTDVEHTLSQKEIINLLEKDYFLSVDRKTIGRNLRDLMEYDKRVYCKVEKKRILTNKETGQEESTVTQTAFYMDKLFDDTELQVLIYNVIFSKHIPSSIKRSMVERLEKLGSHEFHIRMKNMALIPTDNRKDYNDLFLNLELLNEAITEHKKISFQQKYFGVDKLTCISNKKVVMTPFKIAESNDEFYVIGCADYRNKKWKSYEIRFYGTFQN